MQEPFSYGADRFSIASGVKKASPLPIFEGGEALPFSTPMHSDNKGFFVIRHGISRLKLNQNRNNHHNRSAYKQHALHFDLEFCPFAPLELCHAKCP